ncbi:MAG TPA: T9SS type A sorting domain-containing protein [Saprospiraceae bacterium]|nr:T9SS type A sorting domain-containing protein [Saprospiraceae bacterium]
MKPLAFIIFQLLTTLSYSQANWFPDYARWTYQWGAFGGWGYLTMDVLPTDTLIIDQVYKKILISNYLMEDENTIDTVITELRFFFEEDDKVFVKEGGKRLLYDFTAHVGDTLDFMYFGGISPAFFIVDSIGIMEINGVSLKFQDIKFSDLFDPGEFWTMRVVEKIGSLGTHFLYDNTVIQPFDFPSYQLNCYKDEETGYYILPFSSPVDCDQIVSAIAPETSNHFTIYPNPFQDFITIQSLKKDYDHVIIVDMLGRTRRLHSDTISDSIELDLRDLSAGIYVICLVNDEGQILFSEKLMKHF